MGFSLGHVFLRCLGLTIAVVLLLAFVERPSSLSLSSDPRLRSTHLIPPCGATESVELLCLIIFCLDLAVKVNRGRIQYLTIYLVVYFLLHCICIVYSKLSYTLQLHFTFFFFLFDPPELLDWLGGIQKEQMANQLHGGYFSLLHRLDVVRQHGV